jgi:hypothetical protein
MIEFLEEPHIYLKDGIIVPSVTTLIHFIFPDKYKGIGSGILKKKAQFGTKGHSVIEHLGNTQKSLETSKNTIISLYESKEISQDLFNCLREYLRIATKYDIEPIYQEKMISYQYEYCGTLDMIADINGRHCLCDIKFTAECDKEYLAWQLGMYKLAYESEYKDKEFDAYYCIWLPKGKLAELVEIQPKTKEEILSMLEEIKKSKGEK